MHLAGIHANQYPGCIYLCIGHWVVYGYSISLVSRLCVPPTILTERVGSGHETRWYGPTGHLQF